MAGVTPSSAQLALEDAPDGAARQRGAELDVARQAEIGELVDAPAEELLLAEVRALLDRGGDLEVVLGQGAGDGVHRDVGQRAVAHEDRLHLVARDVLTPAAQVVRLAVDEVEVAVFVDPADVARVVPEIAHRLDGDLGTAPVALEHHVRLLGTNHDLAVGSRREFVVVVVEDPDIEELVVDDAGGVGPVLDAWRLPRDQAGLGHAVRTAERLDPEARPKDAVDLGREGDCAHQAQGVVGLRRARARHLGAVDVMRQQVGHRPEGRGDGGPDAVHLGPELRDGEPAEDGAAPAEEERAHDGGHQRVEVVHGERRPRHVVGRALPAESDLPGQGLVVVVRQHAPLGEPGGAAGVDERGQVGRPDVDGRRFASRRHDVVPSVHGHRAERGHGRARRRSRPVFVVAGVHVVDDDHMLERGDVLGDARDAVEVAGSHDDHAGAGVCELVGQVRTLVGGVDGDGDAAGAHGAGPGEECRRGVLEQRRHAVVLRRPELVEDPAEPVGRRHDVAGRELRAGHVEVFAVRVGLEPAGEQLGDRGLLAPGPDAVGHWCSLPFLLRARTRGRLSATGYCM